MFKKLAIATTIGLFSSFNANALAVVDLTGWTAQGANSSWNVQAGNDTVLQTVNGNPTVFFDPTVASTQGTALSGKIKVETTGDDDFIGFALGYSSGGISGSTDFFLVDWKQGNQPYYGNSGSAGSAGLAISHVTGSASLADFWNHTGAVNEIERGTNLGSTGWADNTEYLFNIVFQSNLIEIKVDGTLELSITPDDIAGVSTFNDGAFAFYNYSQSQVLYSSITQTNCQTNPNAIACQTSNVPEPTTLALMGLGLAGFASRSWRKRKLPA